MTISSNDPTAAKPVDPASPKWMKRVPLITGVLAALAGYLTVRQSNLSNEAIYHSNQGVLMQAKASDKWAEYQANSIKARIVETTLDVGVSDPAAKQKLMAQSEKYRTSQPALQDEALAREHDRDEELTGGQRRLAIKDFLNYAGVAAQLGIALASVAALTKRYPVFVTAIGVGLVGVAITVWAILSPMFGHG